MQKVLRVVAFASLLLAALFLLPCTLGCGGDFSPRVVPTPAPTPRLSADLGAPPDAAHENPPPRLQPVPATEWWWESTGAAWCGQEDYVRDVWCPLASYRSAHPFSLQPMHDAALGGPLPFLPQRRRSTLALLAELAANRRSAVHAGRVLRARNGERARLLGLHRLAIRATRAQLAVSRPVRLRDGKLPRVSRGRRPKASFARTARAPCAVSCLHACKERRALLYEGRGTFARSVCYFRRVGAAGSRSLLRRAALR